MKLHKVLKALSSSQAHSKNLKLYAQIKLSEQGKVLYQEIRARQEPTPENGAALGRLTNGESAKRNELKHDGTPCAVKIASTVWIGGKT